MDIRKTLNGRLWQLLFWLTPFKFIVGFLVLALSQIVYDTYLSAAGSSFAYSDGTVPLVATVVVVLGLVDWGLNKFFSRHRTWVIELSIIAGVLGLMEMFG